jgi:hypothetical protein
VYETRRSAMGWFRNVLAGLGSAVLRIVGAVLVVISCALLVYLTAGLLARMVLWAYLP